MSETERRVAGTDFTKGRLSMLLAVSVTLLLAACGSGSEQAEETTTTEEPQETTTTTDPTVVYEVLITDEGFNPHVTDVASPETLPGKVRWTNTTATPQSVVALKGATFRSELIGPGATYEINLDVSGVAIEYVSEQKPPEIVGLVLVRDAAGVLPATTTTTTTAPPTTAPRTTRAPRRSPPTSIH